jgi:solute carrier family 35 protein F3/4
MNSVGLLAVNLSEPLGGSKFLGNLLTINAALFAALYKVFFKYILGDASFGTVSLLLSFLGAFNLFVMWILVVMLDGLRWEIVDFQDIPWNFLVGSSILSLCFNYLVNFGVAYTYPLFISLGTICTSSI